MITIGVMNQITVECTNPREIRLKITAEMAIGEWQEILKEVEDVRYYAPLKELLNAIRQGIDGIKNREEVRWKE